MGSTPRAQDRVLVGDRETVRVLTLNRPAQGNALAAEMRDALSHAFDHAAIHPGVKAVVITGTGESFCNGAALRERRQPEFAGR